MNTGWRGPPLSGSPFSAGSGPGYLVRGRAAIFEPSEARSSGGRGMNDMAEGGMFPGSRQPLYPRNRGKSPSWGGGVTIRQLFSAPRCSYLVLAR